MAGWSGKDMVLVLAGGALLVGGLLGVVSSGIQAVVGRPGDPNATPAIIAMVAATCTIIGVVPGIVLTFWGYRHHRRAAALDAVTTLVRTHRRIRVDDLATKVGKTPVETEASLMDAVEQGTIAGFIDRNTGEFVLSESLWFQQPTARVCPQCGATVQQVYLAGETPRCPYCKSLLPNVAPEGRHP